MRNKVIMGVFLIIMILGGCSKNNEVKIGVSFGAGAATRWDQEKVYMEQKGQELGIKVEVRLNREDKPLTQTEDCIEMIDQGIDVLIIMPRNPNDVKEIVDYAKEKNVPVVSYARLIIEHELALFVGYDSERVGQKMGQYLVETVPSGNYILLEGDANDDNASLIHNGAMRYIEPAIGNINVIFEGEVEKWDPEIGKQIVLDVLYGNQQVDAILAPNDKLAEAARAALVELGISNQVAITGMDAELAAIRRIVKDEQAMTVYMDLKELARTAVQEAYNIAAGKEVNINSTFDNHGSKPVNSNLITGQTITKQNIDRLLIGTGVYTREEVYGD